MLTYSQTRRILIAIDECDAYITKEENRFIDLRSVETQKLLAFYKQHRDNLKSMLSREDEE